MKPGDSIYVAGHRGMVGSAIVRSLRKAGYENLLLRPRDELDLTDGSAVDRFFAEHRPRFIFMAAARVGGIAANAACPADFLRENLAMQLHVIDAARRYDADKLLFLGSSCAYPRLAPQPIPEDALLSGPLEPTNEAYALAKIAGIKLCETYRRQYGCRFISVMPTNLYGPNDNFDLETSHVLPALIRRLHEAREAGAARVVLWGTGTPRREFLHVDDLADACLALMARYDAAELVNVGWGKDISIRELALMIAGIVGYAGELAWDASRPDGTPRKLLDVARITSLGWSPRIPLEQGIRETYEWYRSAHAGAAAPPGTHS